MRRLRDVLYGVASALAIMALVPVLNATQQVPQPGVVPGPNQVHVVGPTPLPIEGAVVAQQGGAWTVIAQQGGTWAVRLTEPTPVATPAFIRQGACYVMLIDSGGTASPVYRVSAIQNGWIQIRPTKTIAGALSAGWINLARMAYAAEAPC
jgi:hypothetical protein